MQLLVDMITDLGSLVVAFLFLADKLGRQQFQENQNMLQA